MREQIPESQVAQNQVAQSEPGQANVGTKRDASVPKQIKELMAQVKAETANSADVDPEMMRQLDALIQMAEAVATDPSQINTPVTSDASVNPVGRRRRR